MRVTGEAASFALRIVALLLFVHGAGSIAAPRPLPAPDLELFSAGNVRDVLVLPDGSVIVAGEFSSVNTRARTNLARIKPDGALDETWHPDVDGAVLGLAFAPGSGDVYIAGQFATVDGHAQAYVARIGADGALDQNWRPVLGGLWKVMAVDPNNGDVYLGGYSGTIEGEYRRGLARMSATGTLDPAWRPTVDGTVRSVALDVARDVLYVGGQFTTAGNEIRHNLARISTEAGAVVDPAWKPDANLPVDVVRFDEVHRRVYVGGAFQFVGGAGRNRIARLDPDGTGAADAWNPSADADVHDIGVDQARASVYALGLFQTIGGTARFGVAKLFDHGTGLVDPAFQLSAFYLPKALAVDEPSGNLHVGGQFTRFGGARRLSYVVLDATGSAIEEPVDFEVPGLVHAVVELPDRSTLIGGSFLKVGSTPRRNLVRIDPSGVPDMQWMPDVDGPVLAIGPRPVDDSIVIAGSFSIVSETPRPALAKLSMSGSGAVDQDWNPAANAAVYAMALSDDGDTLYVGGAFNRLGSETRRRLAKLQMVGDGRPDPVWKPGANGVVSTIALDDSGAFLHVGGQYSMLGDQSRPYIGRIAAAGTGALDVAWNPSADSAITALAFGRDGFLYVGGHFNAIGSLARSRIARLDAAGFADPDWDPSANDVIWAIAPSSDGRVMHLGGSFTVVGGRSREHIARISTMPGAQVDPEWNPAADDSVLALAIAADGSALLAGGAFTRIGGDSRTGIAALPLPGSYPTTSEIAMVEPPSSVVGQSVAIEVAVASDDGTPIGNVLVGDGTTSCVATLDAGGRGTCSLHFDLVGSYSLTAEYDGAGDFGGSMSSAVAHEVGRASTTLSITSHTPDPSLPGEAVRVAAALAVDSPGAGTPAGEIVVSDGVGACTIPAGASTCELAIGDRGTRTLIANYAGDVNFEASSAIAMHRVNFAPVAAADGYEAREDHAIEMDAAHGVLANDGDADDDVLDVVNAGSLVASGIGGSVELAADGSFSFQPPADANGLATFEYTVSDGYETATATAAVVVMAVNDAPHLRLLEGPEWPPGTSGPQEIPGFANVLAFGPPDEAGQQVAAWHVRTIADDSGILVGVPSIDLDGALHVTLRDHAGVATLGVELQDNGGIEGGGIDTSEESTFTITLIGLADRIFDDGFDQ